MPTISIYLNAEMYEKVKSNPSKIIKEALQEKFKEEQK